MQNIPIWYEIHTVVKKHHQLRENSSNRAGITVLTVVKFKIAMRCTGNSAFEKNIFQMPKAV